MKKAAMAVIGRIVETASIEGADRIQQAVVVCGASGKWTGAVGKDMAVGDTVTVFLQDAVLPPDPRWAFMEKHHWRVRMARFKGVPSECVIIPGAPDMPAGTDLTEALGVTKYEKPIPAAMSGDAVGAFPSFIPKTDEPNFQTVPEMVEYLAEGNWYAAEKADGSSTTAWVDEHGALHVANAAAAGSSEGRAGGGGGVPGRAAVRCVALREQSGWPSCFTWMARTLPTRARCGWRRGWASGPG